MAVDHHGGNGIVLKDCYEDPRLVGNIITYNAAAGVLLEGCHDIVVSANQFEENQDAFRCLDSFNLCMTGNNVDDHLRHGVVIENTYGSIVSGNMIEECNGTAMILDRDCYGITVSANTHRAPPRRRRAPARRLGLRDQREHFPARARRLDSRGTEQRPA